jgi:hypothetical protein
VPYRHRRSMPDLVRGCAGPTATAAERWAYVGVAAIGLSGPAFLALAAIVEPPEPPWGAVAFLAYLVAMVGLRYNASKRREYAIASLHRCGYAMCTRCRYVLRGLPDRSSCPECGRPYTMADLRRQWHSAYRLWPRTKTPR